MKELLAYNVAATLRATGAMKIARGLLGGRGVVIMLHEVQPDPDRQLTSACSVERLDSLLTWLRQEGWEFVTLSEAYERLRSPPRPGRFAVLTFDDGYRDNLTYALPVLEKHNAPCVVYVPTGAVTRELFSWWLGLRELFARHDSVAVSVLGREFSCRSLAEKRSALQSVSSWAHQNYARTTELADDFRKYGVCLRTINEQHFVDPAELKLLADHPLVTIGGHTVSHPALATLDEPSALSEIVENRTFLQRQLDQPIEHFAFPYGDPAACGERDARLAMQAGYETAVTTRDRTLRKRILDPHQLPRISVPDVTDVHIFDGYMSGVIPAMAAAVRPLSRGLQASAQIMTRSMARLSPLGVLGAVEPWNAWRWASVLIP